MSSMMQGDPQSPQMAALMQQLGGGSAPDQSQPPSDQGGGGDPLSATQQVIQDLHALIAVLPDPAQTQMAAQALTILTRIQAALMNRDGSGGGSQ